MAESVNVNQELIKAGLAWQYRKYCKASFCNEWLKLEGKAKSAKVGLWSDKDPVPPWEWRKGARNSSFSSNPSGKAISTGNSYHGNTRSHVFHSPACRYYNCKNCVETFIDRQGALSAGYRPCGQCKP